MKSAFLNTVSHELRTPITSIRAFSGLMAKGEAHLGKIREWSAVIEEESGRLNRLVDDLLDVSRIEAGKKLSVVPRPIEPASVFARVAALFAARGTAHPLKLDLDPDLTLAEADPDRLEQVLTNLVSNAIKYSPAGGEVLVRLGFVEPASMRVEVTDRGLGIRPEDRAHLFEKFYRVEGLPQDIRGTGLGLAISKYLVEAHGGRIGVDSEPGKGSTFWFEIPLFHGEAS
jgi:signal transduction histidine kinase